MSVGRFVRDPLLVGTDLHTARDRRNEYLRRVAPSPGDTQSRDSVHYFYRTKVRGTRLHAVGAAFHLYLAPTCGGCATESDSPLEGNEDLSVNSL